MYSFKLISILTGFLFYFCTQGLGAEVPYSNTFYDNTSNDDTYDGNTPIPLQSYVDLLHPLFELLLEQVVIPSDDIRNATEERISTLGRALGDIELIQFLQNIEADRLLLAEIRKQVPNASGEAEVYLARLKDLASRSDPVRLVPFVNRVLAQAGIYFDWLDYEFESDEERITEYYIGGARGFHFALETFKSAVLLTAINRLEIAAKIIRGIYPEELH